MEYMGADKHKAYLFAYKQDKLVAGPNIEITPNEDGKTATISASGGEGTVTDVLVDGVSAVNQDGEAEIIMPSDFEGATSQQAGTRGLVPAPAITDKDKFLKGDGTWGEAGGGNVDDVVMNGQSIVDANKVASFNNYIELTRAEWEALPDSKYSDGILYCIKDSGSEKADFFYPIIYSLAEREVGVWTDGKPLYQRTIHINSLPSVPFTSTPYPHDIADIDVICNYYGVARFSNGTVGQAGSRIFISGTPAPSYVPIAYSWSIMCSKTNIEITVAEDRSAMNADITIRYTKTTDNPGIGQWTPSGVPAVHYDGNEKIIGTWFGQTLYEKTIDCGALPNATTKNIEHRISDLDFIVSANGTSFNGSQHFVIPFVNDGIIGSQVLLFVTATDIVLRTSVDRSAFTKTFVTLQYTKTTD